MPEPQELLAPENYSLEEVSAFIHALSTRDKAKLMAIAKVLTYRYRSRFASADDIVNQALLDLLSGEADWPRNTPSPNRIYQVMANAARRSVPKEDEDVNDIIANHPSQEPAGEEKYAARLDLPRIIQAFSDDPIVQKIIWGIAKGETAQEIQRRHNLPRVTYQSKRTLIRRRLAKLFSEYLPEDKQ